jgi:hypothetical protein
MNNVIVISRSFVVSVEPPSTQETFNVPFFFSSLFIIEILKLRCDVASLLLLAFPFRKLEVRFIWVAGLL